MMIQSIKARFSWARALGHGVFGALVLAWAAWTATAFFFHLEGLALYLGWGALAVVTVLAGLGRLRARRVGWLTLVAAFVLTVGWYQTIRPAEMRDWAFDVARGVTADVEGDLVHLTDVRNFDWHTDTTATARWEQRTYDLSTLARVDMVTSVWDTPDIAHLLVSFGFDDGAHVVFSVETRKEADESYNTLGGFFRQFELVLVAATEEDIIKLRTNYRAEDVRLYPIDLTVEQRRDLFMSYVALAQDLEARPAFYNTLTANCTTTVFRLARVLNPDLRPDWRIVLSGNLPDYVEAQGVLEGDIPLDERMAAAAITAKAQAYQGADFSKALRATEAR
ncbi:MAG: DUF4105 domain-containing protein [Pseudomonadota bacterium]